MKRKVLDWLKRNKDDILMCWGMISTCLALMFLVTSILFMVISDDLVGRVELEVSKQEELKVDLEAANMKANYYYYLSDELQQTYEDVVPKQQYIDDIEYLESVIRELRDESYNSKEKEE